MIKKVLATTAVAASVVGISATAAPQAMADGGRHGTTTFNGNAGKSVYGNSATRGKMSPQLELVQGSLNQLCAALIGEKLNVGSVFGYFVPVTVQDINVLSNPQVQQCVRNSTQTKGDEPLSHVLSNIPIKSGNGGGGGKKHWGGGQKH